MENVSNESVSEEVKRKDKLPKTPFANIAISFSGGGYRATSFHLGILTYLSSKKFDEISLLERTRVLSTVSAGTFAGVKYAATIKKGGSIKDCYNSMYDFMSNCDLISRALEYLSDDNNWKGDKQRTLINSFAAIYHKEFESDTFGLLWKENPIHLKEIYFNATEFNFALPFRFQKSENTGIHKDEFIGNKKIRIPAEVAKEIRLSDIIAASSCFPFGFEPINFPNDFMYPEADKLKYNSLLPKYVYDGDKIEYPIGLMDGSIDDNQGVDAVVTAEERMKQYPAELKQFCSDDNKAVDLYIVCDVSPHTMESYIRSTTDKIPGIGRWNFESLRYFGLSSAVCGLTAIFLACWINVKPLIIVFSVFGTFGIMAAFILFIFSKGITGLTRKLGVPDFVVKRLLHFDRLKFGTLYNLFVNRRRSGMKLVSDVFIRQMKWFSFERIYGDRAWKPRVVMNAAHKLSDTEVDKRRKKHHYLSEELLNPGAEITLATAKANSMATSLWFTNEELEGSKNKLDTLIACGQYTTCYSLLEYIGRTIKHEKYEADYQKYGEHTKKAIDELEAALLADWRKFKKDPYWMVREWNQKEKQ